MKGGNDGTGEKGIFALGSQNLIADQPEAGQDQGQDGKFEDQAEDQDQAKAEVDIGADVEPALQSLCLVGEGKIDDHRPDDNQEEQSPGTEGERGGDDKWHHYAAFFASQSRRNEQPQLVKDYRQDQYESSQHGDFALDKKRLERCAVVEDVLFMGAGDFLL